MPKNKKPQSAVTYRRRRRRPQFEADLLDVLDIRVPQEEELVSEHEVRLLSSLLAIHGGCRLGD